MRTGGQITNVDLCPHTADSKHMIFNKNELRSADITRMTFLILNLD